MIKCFGLSGVALSVVITLSSAPVLAEQTMSERLGDILEQRVDSHLDADFAYESLELVTLLGELRAQEIRLSTRAPELDAGLNEVLRADSVVVEGEWLGNNTNTLIVDSITAKDAQLTVAYWGKGQSNLHALYNAANEQGKLQRVSQPIIWQVKRAQLDNVVLNLFDQGQPILSVRLASLELPEASADDTADTYIARLLWPVLEQVLEQAMAGNSDAVVDYGRLTQFIWREIR
ncbi:hypothetical protein [Pseudidiomarina andamanensis]|uniref:Uncharacterized protein n=1 Tax=Pseudidiomarina andamanensis TaxID=1940690 RepID=A0AA92EP42_9GAMM|nr:hypothetical protein [Pseudidiomarina andamanensis]MDS0217887.1 hypothetical protein [Pseudidiomarina andamanensis]QGT94782.1 hypothetical protein D3795_00665 [Pseudidiomarina andamanensis]